jgi:hypothetical protein
MNAAELAGDIDVVRAVTGNICAGTTDGHVMRMQVKVLQPSRVSNVSRVNTDIGITKQPGDGQD